MSIIAKAPVIQDCHIANIHDSRWYGRYLYQTGRCSVNWIGCWDWDSTNLNYAGLYAYQSRTLQKFNLPKLPANAQIKSAKLKMWMWKSETMHSWNNSYYTYNQNPTIEVRKMTQDWDEGLGDGLGHGYQYSGATWTTRKLYGYSWTTAGGTFDPIPAASVTGTWASGVWEFDITGLVNFWYQNPTQNYGVMLKYANDQNPQGAMYMAGTELGWTNDNAPHIEIEYVGVPNPARGLSPNYGSVLSPQIPNSMNVSWQFDSDDSADTQQYVKITVTDQEGTIQIYNHQYGDMMTAYTQSSIPVSDFLGSLIAGHDYTYTVEAFNSLGLSGGAVTGSFKYKTLPTYQAKHTWTSLPEKNEDVKLPHFTELQDALRIEATKYDGMTTAFIDPLFTDQSSIFGKKDFKNFFTALDQIQRADNGNVFVPLSGTIGSVPATSVNNLLSANNVSRLMQAGRTVMKGAAKPEDISWLRSMIDSTVMAQPTVPTTPSYKVTAGSLISPNSLTTTHLNNTTYSRQIKVSWAPVIVTPQSVAVTLYPSPSTDIAYYHLIYNQVTESGKIFPTSIYFDKSMIPSSGDTFTLNIPDVDISYHSMALEAIDRNGNISQQQVSLLKSPIIGKLSYYEVQFQQTALAVTSYDLNGTWYKAYQGKDLSFVHEATGYGNFFYRIRVVDANENTGAWTYAPGRQTVNAY